MHIEIKLTIIPHKAIHNNPNHFLKNERKKKHLTLIGDFLKLITFKALLLQTFKLFNFYKKKKIIK